MLAGTLVVEAGAWVAKVDAVEAGARATTGWHGGWGVVGVSRCSGLPGGGLCLAACVRRARAILFARAYHAIGYTGQLPSAAQPSQKLKKVTSERYTTRSEVI
jgi:hypothetical protein